MIILIKLQRNKFLFVGQTGVGKTRALFDIALRYMGADKQVFYLAFDAGYTRHLPKVDGYFVYHTEPEYSSAEEGEKFHLWDCGDLVTARRAYRDAKMLMNKGDALIMDRIDLHWERAQEHYIRNKVGVAGLEAEPDLEGGFENVDWQVIKENHNSVAFDGVEGTDTRLQRINVFASALAQPGITSWTKKGQTETKKSQEDPRKLRSLGVTIKGEGNVPTYFDTLVLMELAPQGYVMSTSKDRERELIHRQVIEDGEQFWDAYERLTGMKLEV